MGVALGGVFISAVSWVLSVCKQGSAVCDGVLGGGSGAERSLEASVRMCTAVWYTCVAFCLFWWWRISVVICAIGSRCSSSAVGGVWPTLSGGGGPDWGGAGLRSTSLSSVTSCFQALAVGRRGRGGVASHFLCRFPHNGAVSATWCWVVPY